MFFSWDAVMVKGSTRREFDLFVGNMVNTQTPEQLLQIISIAVKTR